MQEFKKKRHNIFGNIFEDVISDVIESVSNVAKGFSNRVASDSATSLNDTKEDIVTSPISLDVLFETLVLNATIDLPKLSLCRGNLFDYNAIERLYEGVPIEVENFTISLIEKIYKDLSFDSDESTYEEILKFFIEKSADASFFSNLDGMPAFLNVIIKIYNRVSNDTISEYGDVLHTQTIALSIIWGSMFFSLIKKAGSEPVQSEKTIVARGVISIAVALIQVMHREMPVWKYIGTIYKAYTTIGDWSRKNPTLYKVLFPSIYIDTVRYPMWHKNIEKHIGNGYSRDLSVGKAINMSYTFRIGDSFIKGMKGHSMLTKDVFADFVNCLCPIPREKEIKRLISLYVYNNIY